MSDLAAVEYALCSLGQASPNITASYIQVLYNHVYIQYCPGRIYMYIHVYSTAQGVYTCIIHVYSTAQGVYTELARTTLSSCSFLCMEIR